MQYILGIRFHTNILHSTHHPHPFFDILFNRDYPPLPKLLPVFPFIMMCNPRSHPHFIIKYLVLGTNFHIDIINPCKHPLTTPDFVIKWTTPNSLLGIMYQVPILYWNVLQLHNAHPPFPLFHYQVLCIRYTFSF